MISIYESEEKFLTIFNPGNQFSYTRDLERVFCGKAPTLSLVAKAFGTEARDNWLDIQLTELAAFSGCRDKMTDYQIETIITIIAEEYSHLKVTEMMYFFRKFKIGAYGKFFGAVDPLTITCALKEFCDERSAILSRISQRRREEEKMKDPDHIQFLRQYEAYEKMCQFYSLNFRSNDFTLDDFKEIWWLFNLGYERKDHGYSG